MIHRRFQRPQLKNGFIAVGAVGMEIHSYSLAVLLTTALLETGAFAKARYKVLGIHPKYPLHLLWVDFKQTEVLYDEPNITVLFAILAFKTDLDGLPS